MLSTERRLKMTRTLRLLALLLTLGLLVAACGDSDSDDSAPATEAPATTTEAPATTQAPATTEAPATTTAPTTTAPTTTGAAPEFPSRIISLSPSSTEILFAIGAGDQVIAVDTFSYFPEEAPVTDLSGFTPNVEAILAFEPDMLVWSGGPDDVTGALESAGVPVINHFAPADFDGIYAQIAELGELTGQIDAAAALVEQMRADLEEIAASVEPRDEPITYFHEVGTEYYSATSATFIGNIYGLANMENIADPADPDGSQFGFPLLNEEFILDADPQLMFLADTIGYGQSAETVAARPGWENLQAVQNGRVIELNDDIVSRWGPRVVDFARQVIDAVNAVQPVG